MNSFWKGFIVALIVVYVILPRDFVPGPVDDILLMFLMFVACRRKSHTEEHDNDKRIEVVDSDCKESK